MQIYLYVYIYTDCFSGIDLAPLEFNELSYFYSGVIVNINWLAQVMYVACLLLISHNFLEYLRVREVACAEFITDALHCTKMRT